MRLLKIVIVIYFCVSLVCSPIYAATYGAILYSDLCYQYASECNMSTDVFDETQIRINKAIYGQAAVIFSEDHFKNCYGDVDTPLFNSFKDHFTPLVPLAFSIAEWGANGDLRYSFTPAIATKKLDRCGVVMEFMNPLEVNSQTYLALGADVWDTRSYWGPLQINKSYLVPTESYKCGYIPMDYYSWPDSCQWTFHNKCNSIKSAYCKDREFKCAEEVLAVLSIAHNSGGTFINSRIFNTDAEWYPWRDSESVWDYCSVLTKESNLSIIYESADKYADELLQKYKEGSEGGGLYLSITESREMFNKMGINLNIYLKDRYSNSMTAKAWEKTMYPIQSIWNYRVLERLYGLREDG